MQINGIGSGFSALTAGKSAIESSKIQSEQSAFSSILENMSSSSKSNSAGAKITEIGRVSGDWTTGFSNTYTSEADKKSLPRGAAANQAAPGKTRTIDRTSALYESSLALESYLVKQMLGEMRKTVMKADGDGSQAQKMYEDMLFDEYAVSMTKGAGFGLADQIYLQLSNDGQNDCAV